MKKALAKIDLSFLSILALTAALYLGFSELINHIATESAREAINAAIGVIFVIMTTMYMLNKQTEVDRKRDFDSEILKKKLATYERSLSVWQRVGLADSPVNDIDRAECLEVQLQMMMVAPKAIVACAVNITNEINKVYTADDQDGFSEKEKKPFFTELVRFAVLARKDLDLPETNLGMDQSLPKSMTEVVGEVATSSKRNLDKFVYNGKEFGKGRLVLEIVKVIAQERKIRDFDQLRNMFPDTWHSEGHARSSKTGRVVLTLEDAKQLHKGQKDNKDRFFMKETDWIPLADGSHAVVSNQWGANIDYFLQQVSKNLDVKVRRIPSG